MNARGVIAEMDGLCAAGSVGVRTGTRRGCMRKEGHLSLRLSLETLGVLRQEAERQDRSLSWLCAKILESYTTRKSAKTRNVANVVSSGSNLARVSE